VNAGAQPVNFNDQYYDLDDDFIDDDNEGADEMVADIQVNDTVIYSELSALNED